MDEYLYCVTAQGWDNCKLGIWQGHYADLWSRYATPFGPDIVTVTVFTCRGRRALEKVLFGLIRTMHISGEVYHQEAQELFLKFCRIMCLNSVPMPLSNSEKDKRDAMSAERKQVKARHKMEQLAAEESRRKAKTSVLDKDAFQKFVIDKVVVGTRDNFVKLKDLYHEFAYVHPGKGKSRAILKYTEFRSGVERVLQTTVRARHMFMSGGKQCEATSAIVGFARKLV